MEKYEHFITVSFGKGMMIKKINVPVTSLCFMGHGQFSSGVLVIGKTTYTFSLLASARAKMITYDSLNNGTHGSLMNATLLQHNALSSLDVTLKSVGFNG